MYIRILDDNEACGSELLFRTKEDVIAWLKSWAEEGNQEAIDAFIKNDCLNGQDDDCGTYEYIQKIDFEK